MSYQNPPRKPAYRLSTPVRLGVAAVAACFISAPVLSLPVNPTVVNGAASFNQVGKVLTVTNSNGAIINWNKFSIGAGETTHFAQTSASSSVLNRVLSDPTAIYGTLSSNGRVWLVNPAGIMVGPGGRVDVAGFVASTLNISNANFLAGRNVFVNDGSAKDVINQGEIRTPAGGSVYLIGSNVTNEGIITTPKGETILAAGATVSLIDSATPGVKVDITGAEGNATNLGTITAEAGRIGIAGVIVRNSGQINASSVVSEGGRVFLKASQDAYVDGNGRIVTTGTRGGSVEVLGNHVAVMDNAEIDASGTNGGGRIMVGGDYQGKNADVQNASISYFGPNASLKADAKEVGDGGTVIVWADDTTRAYGSISARGGATGGDGGFVETSGHRSLDIAGARVDTRAPQGATGQWLLDPTDVTISGAPPTTGGSLSGGVFTPSAGSSTIYAGDINSNLTSNNVVISTNSSYGGTGSIAVNNSNISGPSGPYGGLSLLAYGGTGNIQVNNSSIDTNGLTMVAGWSGSGTGTTGTAALLTVTNSKLISKAGMTLKAAGDMSFNGDTQGVWVQSTGSMDLQARNIFLNGGSAYGQNPNMPPNAGAGVFVKSGGPQIVAATASIVLQAGSANNNYGGSSYYGGSVGIYSDASQTISANVIRVLAGVSGHDNAAEIQAFGHQAINITGTGGLLEVKGGGDSTTVYGGPGSVGSFNNQARITHGQWVSNDSYIGTGDQTITISGGGTVNVISGSGTGVLGYYGSDCASSGAALADCRGSSNSATIENGIGAQKLDFLAGGTLYVKGGNAGRSNWAGIENNGINATSQTIDGSPNITLTGGDAGGSAVSYGSETFEHSNDAGIFSESSGGQFIHAGSLTLNGGNATYGGAGISSDGVAAPLNITTSGDLSMYGGTSNAAHPYGSAVYIHSEYGGHMKLDVAGNLYVKAGSGTSAPAIIGSVDGRADVEINVGFGAGGSGAGNVTIISDGSGVGIGSLSAAYGANVFINAERAITVTDSATSGVTIGSRSDTGAGTYGTDVGLSAGTDINIGTATGYGALVGVKTPTRANRVGIFAGGMNGGNVNLYASSRVKAGLSSSSEVIIGAAQTTANNGNITQYGGSQVYGGYVGIFGGGNVDLSGAVTASNFLSVGAGDGGEGGMGLLLLGGGGFNPTLFGGNLDLRAGSNLSAPDIDLTANGTFDGQRGVITQAAGSTVTATTGDVYIAGQGDVTLNGNVTASNGGIFASAGLVLGANEVYDPETDETSFYPVAYASDFGGTLTIGSTANIQANQDIDFVSSKDITINGPVTSWNGAVSMAAGFEFLADPLGDHATSSPLGGTLTIATTGNVDAEDGVVLFASKDININGTVTSYGYVAVAAGFDATSAVGGPQLSAGGFGGNVTIAGNIYSDYDGISILASANESGSGTTGNIKQTGGSIFAYNDDIAIVAGGSVELGGTVTANSGNLSVMAGYQAVYDGGHVTYYGGDITISGALYGWDGVALIAESGNPGLKGIVKQTGGSITAGWNGNVTIYGGGSVTLNGSIDGGEGCCGPSASVIVKSGFSGHGGNLTRYGGDISVGGTITGYRGVEMYAFSGFSSPRANGNIKQTGGSITSDDGNIGIFADGDVNLNGLVATPNSLYIRAGLDNGWSMGNPHGTSSYGGNVALGAASRIYGGHVELSANGGYYGGISATGSSTGNITQAAGGQLKVFGVDSLYGHAAGSVELSGTTVVYGGAPVSISAGTSYPTETDFAFANKHITIDSLDAYGSSVSLYATGLISANMTDARYIYANISESSSGGIDITNNSWDQQPISVNLTDNATSGSAIFRQVFASPTATLYGSGISLTAQPGGFVGLSSNRDLTYGGGGFFFAGGGGIIGFAANNGILNIDSALVGGTDSVELSAGTLNIWQPVSGVNITLDGSTTHVVGATTATGDLTAGGGAMIVDGALHAGNDMNLGGTTIDVSAGVTAGNNIEIGATTINIKAGGSVVADNNVALVTPLVGGTINLDSYGGVVAKGLSGTPSTINGIPYKGIAFIAQDLTADSGYLDAQGLTGDISGLVSGNVTLNNGAYFSAGNDIELVLAGSDSTVSLSNGSYMLADYQFQEPTTIFLDFLTRGSGGVMIDGAATTTSAAEGSGFFVVNHQTPATESPGGGLVITYANPVTVDPCTTSPDLCKPPLPVDNPISDITETEADPCATAPDSAQCKKSDEDKDKDKGTFGEDDGKKDDQSTQKKVAKCDI